MSMFVSIYLLNERAKKQEENPIFIHQDYQYESRMLIVVNYLIEQKGKSLKLTRYSNSVVVLPDSIASFFC